MKKKLTSIIFAILLGIVIMSKGKNSQNEALPKIAIVQLVEHTSLNLIRDTLLGELVQLGYQDGVNCHIIYENAQGDMNVLSTIMRTISAQNINLMIPITTPVAQAAMELTKQGIPMVFSAISNPIQAGVVKDMKHNELAITGTSDAVAMTKIMDLMRVVVPDVRKIGYIYNPGEDNSVSNLEIVERYCNDYQLELIVSGIGTASELSVATHTVCDQVDAIVLGNDNTVAQSMPVLAKIAIEEKIPVFAGADSMVQDGALATVGIDYVNLGKETAHLADSVLHGTFAGDIPIQEFNEDLNIYVNRNTLQQLGLQLPAVIQNDAHLIFMGE